MFHYFDVQPSNENTELPLETISQHPKFISNNTILIRLPDRKTCTVTKTSVYEYKKKSQETLYRE